MLTTFSASPYIKNLNKIKMKLINKIRNKKKFSAQKLNGASPHTQHIPSVTWPSTLATLKIWFQSAVLLCMLVYCTSGCHAASHVLPLPPL